MALVGECERGGLPPPAALGASVTGVGMAAARRSAAAATGSEGRGKPLLGPPVFGGGRGVAAAVLLWRPAEPFPWTPERRADRDGRRRRRVGCGGRTILFPAFTLPVRQAQGKRLATRRGGGGGGRPAGGGGGEGGEPG